jgi:hypothetical protein
LWASIHGIYNLMWKCNVLDQNYKHDSFVTKSSRSLMFKMPQGYDQCYVIINNNNTQQTTSGYHNNSFQKNK